MRYCPEWLREIDHTADAGIAVSGGTREEFFERAAFGMFWLIASVESVAPVTLREIELRAGDLESMLVKWLSELNYLHQVEGLVFSRFEIDTLRDGLLQGRAYGDAAGGDESRVFGEIKAVTFHGLDVIEHDGHWSATIIFDL